jgi:hypothetical protein
MPPYRTIPSNEEPQVSPDTVTAIEKAPEQPLELWTGNSGGGICC